MIKHNQDGAVNGVVISLILTVLVLIGAIAFGGWAYSERQDYKDNVDQKIAIAEQAAIKQEGIAKDKIFAEKYKYPYDTYNGPEATGSLVIVYPKTWSSYIDDSGKGSAPLDGYFKTGTVPSINDQNSVFALRTQVVSQEYSSFVKNLSSQQKSGKIKVSAYALPKVPKTVGVIITGEFEGKKSLTMVVLPLRSQTLKIWTEGTTYLNDFNKIILPNFSFSP